MKNASFFTDDLRSFAANYGLLATNIGVKKRKSNVTLSQYWY